MKQELERLDEPVLRHARRDVAKLRLRFTVRQALEAIRQQGVGEKIVYFYVVDDLDRLVGVLPTRRLLTSPLDRVLGDIMISRVVAIPHTATVLDACELFVLHKFLAFPVVDEQRHILGIVDVALFTSQVLDFAEPPQMDDVFESIGFRVSQVRDASPFRVFRYRFPWLMTTITSGMLCAFLASVFEATLARSLVLAFFLTLVLALGESVSVQSMTVTIQSLRSTRPSLAWFFAAFRREAGTAVLLGGASGLLVGLIVWLWRGAFLPAGVIGGSIFLALCAACASGLSIPALLHWLKLDPKIAAGPVALAITDLCTLTFYFNMAALLL